MTDGADPGASPRDGASALHDDSRGVSTPLSHVFALGITSVLLILFLTTAGSFVQENRERAATDNVEVIGNRMAAEIASLDQLVSETGAGTSSDPVSVTLSFPGDVTGKDYAVRRQTGSECEGAGSPCLEVAVDGLDVERHYPLALDPGTSISIRPQGGGRYRVAAWSGAAPSTGDPGVEPSLRVGVGATYVFEPDAGGTRFNRPPRAAYSRSPVEPTSGPGTTLDASASVDPDGSIVAYRWDVDGDGVYDRRGKTIDVELSPGTTDVKLEVVDDGGKVNTETKNVDASGVAYVGDMDIDASWNENSLAFSIENEWSTTVDLDQLLVDPKDDGIDGFQRDGDWESELRFSGLGVEENFDWEGVPTDGRFFTFTDEDRDELGSNNAGEIAVASFQAGGSPANMLGKVVTVAVRYEVGGDPRVSRFSDTVGDPDVRNFRVVRSGDQIRARFESTADVEATADAGMLLEVDRLNPDGSTANHFEISTLTSSNDAVDCSAGAGAFYDCTVRIAGPNDPDWAATIEEGQYVATVTQLRKEYGATDVQSDRLPISDSVVHFEGDYVWQSASDWDDAVSQRGVVHEAFAGFGADSLRVGLPGFDQGGSGLVGYYPFERPSGVAVDASGNGNHGAIQQAGYVLRDVLGLGGSRSIHFETDRNAGGNIQHAGHVRFNGGGVSSLRGGPDGTVSAGLWFKPTDTVPSQGSLLAKKPSGGGSVGSSPWGLVVRDSCPSGSQWVAETTCVGSGPYVGFYSADGGNKYGVFYGPIERGRWEHASFSMDGPDDQLDLYVGGEKVASATMPDDVAGENNKPARLGRGFTGKIEDARVYDRALTDRQAVEHLYHSAYNGTLTTDWRTGAAMEQTDLELSYAADVGPGQEITVTVVTPDGESEPVTLGDGVGRADVLGLPSGDADKYRLRIQMDSASRATTPRLRAVELEET